MFHPYPFLFMLLSGACVGALTGLAGGRGLRSAAVDTIAAGACGILAARYFWPAAWIVAPDLVAVLGALGRFGMIVFLLPPVIAGLSAIACLTLSSRRQTLRTACRGKRH
jgi:hypothetical protein